MWIGLNWCLWKPFLAEATSEIELKQMEIAIESSDKWSNAMHMLLCEMSEALASYSVYAWNKLWIQIK